MTNVEFIEFRKKYDPKQINFEVLDNLPKDKISLGASVQYLDFLIPIKDYFKKNNREVIVKKGSYYDGQVLGCNSNAFDYDSDILLLLCDGKFHALNNSIQLKKEIYVFNGLKLDKIEKNELEIYFKKIKGKQMKYLNSKNIGILVSNKKGQRSYGAFKIRERIEKSGKKVYVFFGDSLSINEFDNFPDIDIWVNTACFGLAMDNNKIVNLSDILEFLN